MIEKTGHSYLGSNLFILANFCSEPGNTRNLCRSKNVSKGEVVVAALRRMEAGLGALEQYWFPTHSSLQQHSGSSQSVRPSGGGKRGERIQQGYAYPGHCRGHQRRLSPAAGSSPEAWGWWGSSSPPGRHTASPPLPSHRSRGRSTPRGRSRGCSGGRPIPGYTRTLRRCRCRAGRTGGRRPPPGTPAPPSPRGSGRAPPHTPRAPHNPPRTELQFKD